MNNKEIIKFNKEEVSSLGKIFMDSCVDFFDNEYDVESINELYLEIEKIYLESI